MISFDDYEIPRLKKKTISPIDQLADLNVLIKRATEGDEEAFKKIYTLLAGKMYSLCLRYTGNLEDANDTFQNGFIQLFRNLGGFRHEGSFEGWVRRIFVNTCLDFTRNKRRLFIEINTTMPVKAAGFTVLDKLAMEDLMKLIQKMPNGYRTIFNLYLVEGYNHKEISEMLQIEEGTSKSQLSRAKQYLKELLIDRE